MTWNRFFFVLVTGWFVEPVFQRYERLVVVLDYASVMMWTRRFPHSGDCSGANGWQDHKMKDQRFLMMLSKHVPGFLACLSNLPIEVGSWMDIQLLVTNDL
jgi:hypothetical protein